MNDQTVAHKITRPSNPFIDGLLSASSNIHEVTARRRAQLSAALSLTLAVISVIILVSTLGSPDTTLSIKLGSVILSALLIISYVLSRTNLYDIGSVLCVLIVSSLDYLVIYIYRIAPTENTISNLVMASIPISLVIASTLLPSWFLAVIAFLNVGAILYLPDVFPAYAGLQSRADAMIVFSISFVIFAITLYRNATEKQRLDELEQSNRELQTHRRDLEEIVALRTEEINRRSGQLEAAAMVARTAAEVRDLKELLNDVVHQITDQFGFYHAGIFLVDHSQERVVLQAASSEGGKRMVERGHALNIGQQGLVGYAAFQKSPRIAQDVGVDAVFFNNPELPETHSEVALPLTVRGRLIGVLDIQSTDRNAFSTNEIYTLQTMADQIALAIQNANLIEESQNALRSLEGLNIQNAEKAWKERLGRKIKGYVYTSLGTVALDDNPTTSHDEPGHLVDIPIRLRGQEIGTVTLKRSQSESDWTIAERELADKIADQIALAIENARLLEESQKRAARELTVNEITGRFTRSLDVDALLQNAIKELHRLPSVTDVSVFVSPDSETDHKQQERE